MVPNCFESRLTLTAAILFAAGAVSCHPGAANTEQSAPKDIISGQSRAVRPTFYYTPETCGTNAIEGISICRRAKDLMQGYVLYYTGKRFPLWSEVASLEYASKVLNVFGSRMNTLHVLRSIAMDHYDGRGRSLPNDKTRVYLPAFKNRTFAIADQWVDHQGKVRESKRFVSHDGCFIKSDTGGAFTGKGYNRIDIYTGLKDNYVKFVGGEWKDLNSKQTAIWDSAECADKDWNLPGGVMGIWSDTLITLAEPAVTGKGIVLALDPAKVVRQVWVDGYRLPNPEQAGGAQTYPLLTGGKRTLTVLATNEQNEPIYAQAAVTLPDNL